MENIDFQAIADSVTPHLLSIAYALVIFVVGRIAAKILTRMIRKGMDRTKVDQTISRFVCNIAYAILLIFVVLAALNQLGFQTTSLIAVIGAAGLAVGLALQGSLSNFAAGFLLILFKPFKAGDFVEAGGTAGIVEEVGIFTTVLKTPDNKIIIVPNSNISNDNITNYSANETRRLDLVIGVSYTDDLMKVRSVIDEILEAEERVLKDPAPTVGVLELGDSSVNFAVRPWVQTADYWPVLFHLTETIKTRFDQENISIPFPQRDLHIVDGGITADSSAA